MSLWLNRESGKFIFRAVLNYRKPQENPKNEAVFKDPADIPGLSQAQ
jgi:hypothetical protein